MKILKISLWSLLTVFFAIMFAAVMLAESITGEYALWINNFLKIDPYSKVTGEEESEQDMRYYTSDYEFIDSEGNLYYDDEAMREHSIQTSLKAATDGSVLLWNNGGALPLGEGAKISFFGGASMSYLYHGGGSGYVQITTNETLKSACESEEYGLKVNGVLWNAYKQSNYSRGSKSGLGSDKNYLEYTINEIPWTRISTAVNSSIKNYGDAAVMVISRMNSENGDTFFRATECLDENYLDLSKTEESVLKELVNLRNNGSVKKVILLINSPAAMQFKHISKLGLDACLWVGMGGSASYKQVAALLSGKANPYGRLTDTYVYDNDSAPATVNFGDFTFTQTDSRVPANTDYSCNNKYVVYQEGIYVGYRYYETRYEDAVLGQGNADSAAGVKAGAGGWSYADEVAYPFGYGDSYTDFTYTNFTKPRKTDGGYEVSLTVKNTGSGYSGREVMQVYLQKPYTDYDRTNGIEKASVELVGFAKTPELAPGESATLTVTVPEYEFKTYDSYNSGTYILEKGDYYLAAGVNAHDALNNILAAKGKTVSDGMDKNGNSAFAHKITVSKDDFKKYSVSPYTKKAITNQFDNADLNLYDGTEGQEVTYLSRSDWESTYPQPVQLSCTGDIMANDMQYGEYPNADPADEMPIFGTVTSPMGKLTLPMLKDLAFDDPTWEDFLNQLTWEDANKLVTNGANQHVAVIDLIVPPMWTDDGPCGIRQKRVPPPAGSMMAFPCNSLIGCTWDTEIVKDLGDAFGMEIMHVGYTGIWGTGANIHRTAYSGRNWEYFSEDGFISGKMFAAHTAGLQQRGVIAFTKHFALNDQERNRYGETVWANEQTIREVYLKAFEAGVTEGKANGIMSSLTRIGCTWAGRHKGLLTGVLRTEWGFTGICETDAKAGEHQWNDHASACAVIAGQDLWLGSGSADAFNEYRDNATVCKAIREACHRIVYNRLHSNAINGYSTNTKIIYNTPWWVTALKTVQIVSGIITGACLAMAVASIVINKVKEKNV